MLKLSLLRVFIVLCLAASSPLWAQEETPAEAETSGESSEEGESNADDSSAANESSSSESSSAEDMSYEELVSRALELGIDTSGNRFILMERLKDVLELETQGSQQSSSNESPLTEIESADAGSYTQSGPDNELLLQGNVRVIVQDEANGITNTISADFILYNQEQQQLSARGNVRYSIEGRMRNEEFTGDELLFLLNENDTLFFDGGGLSEQEANEEALEILRNLRSPTQVQYHYRAEFITRNSDNIIIMDNGIITSSLDPSPTYRFQFKKLWLLSPGEVGVDELVLYVGNIPLFGLPFLYLPGNEVVFSPVFVLNDERGIGLNTTTYFAGQKENDDLPFSFLQLGTERSESATRPMGIFLQPLSPSEESEREEAEESEDSDDSASAEDEEILKTARLYVDGYTKRGLFLGLDAEFNPSGSVSTAKGLILLAITRELYRNADETTSLSSENNEVVSRWHETRLGSIRIPLRYILDLEFALRSDAFSFNFDIPIYSDPYINGEFSVREENIPWDDLIFGANIDDQMLATTELATMNWVLNFSINPSLPQEVRPFINSLRFGNFATTFAWRAETDRMLPPEHSSAINSPERRYYAPDRFELPSGTVSIAGQILNFSLPVSESDAQADTSDTENEEERPAIFDEIQAPEDRSEEAEEGESDSRSGTARNAGTDRYIRPQSQSNTRAPSFNTPLNYSLGYSASNRHFLSLVFNNPNRQNSTEDPNNIDDYYITHIRFEDTISGSLTQNLRFFQSLLSLQSVLRYSGAFAENFAFSDRLTSEQRTNLSNQTAAATQTRSTHTLILENTATVNFFEPLQTDLSLGVTYRNVLRLVESRLDNERNPVENIFEWDEEHVTTHSMNFLFMLPLFSNSLRQGLTLNFVLPPLNETITTGYTLGIGPLGSDAQFTLTTGLNLSVINRNDEFIPEELRFTFDARIFREISLNGTFTWNLENEVMPEQYRIGLRIFWYTASIDLRDRQISRLNDRRTAWTRSMETEFQLSNMQHSLNIPIKFVDEGIFELDSSIGLSWNHDFVEFTSSRLSFNFSIGILIPRFLLVRFSVRSSNNAIYSYFPEYTAQLGNEALGIAPPPTRNFFEDLFRSFNFFDDAEREDSFFKLDTVGLELYHDLNDWVLSFSYNWRPITETINGQSVSRIENRVSIFLQWLPIEELNSDISIEEENNSWLIEY